MTVVGSVAVRIRPFVSEEDARALEAIETLTREIGSAFDRFRETLAAAPAPLPTAPDPRLIREETIV